MVLMDKEEMPRSHGEHESLENARKGCVAASASALGWSKVQGLSNL